MGHAHVVLPRPDRLYGPDEGFLDRVIHKAMTHPKSALATTLAIIAGLTGSAYLVGSRNHYTAEDLNRAVNVPAQTQVVEHTPVAPALPALPTRPPESRETTSQQKEAYKTTASTANPKVSGYQTNNATTDLVVATTLFPPATIVMKPSYVDGDPITLKKYFGLAEEKLRGSGVTGYRFQICDYGKSLDGRDSKTIELQVFSNGVWHSTTDPARQYR